MSLTIMDAIDKLNGTSPSPTPTPSSNVIILHWVDEHLDKTWNEIKAAIYAGKSVILEAINSGEHPYGYIKVVTGIYYGNELSGLTYGVHFNGYGDNVTAKTDDPDDYPRYIGD